MNVYSACVRPALLYAEETWALMDRMEILLASCDPKISSYMSRVR